eukprot:7154007-Pyramimonas_sp.AAC.1
MASDAWRQMHGVRCMAPDTWRRLLEQMHGVRCMASDAWRRIHGVVCSSRCMASDAWHQMHGAGCMASDAWLRVQTSALDTPLTPAWADCRSSSSRPRARTWFASGAIG